METELLEIYRLMGIKSIIVLAFAFLLIGCATPYEESYQTTSLLNTRTSAISESAEFIVAVEGEGAYAGRPKDGSGAVVRTAMVEALSAHVSGVTIAPGFLSEAEAIADARGRGVDYLVYLRILHWESRATAWSGKPDRVELEIRLVDARGGEVLESRLLKANSKWMTLGGDRPEDLLVKPFGSFAASLFGATAPVGSS